MEFAVENGATMWSSTDHANAGMQPWMAPSASSLLRTKEKKLLPGACAWASGLWMAA
jgi:hypothetical protein